MRSLLEDLRYGLRMMRRSPGPTLFAVAALALGIGANTAIFSLVDTLLLRPLPYREPDRLVQVWEDARHVGFPRNTPAPANYHDWRADNHVFEDMAASRGASPTLTGGGREPEAVMGRSVTANLFGVLGVAPALGRSFGPEDEREGAAPVAILGHDLWQRRFGGARDVVGATRGGVGRAPTNRGRLAPRGV
jgi:hypothetical protein